MRPLMNDARAVAHEEQVSLRLPKALLERAEALTEKLREDPDNALIGVTRATVLRLAIARGLAALEAQHGERKSEPKPKKR